MHGRRFRLSPFSTIYCILSMIEMLEFVKSCENSEIFSKFFFLIIIFGMRTLVVFLPWKWYMSIIKGFQGGYLF